MRCVYIHPGIWKRWCLLPFLVLVLLLTPSVAKAKDYYSILGIRPDATDQQIKRAYKRQAMKWHPDKHQENKDKATAKFQDIAQAYEALSDPEKRRLYDLGGEEALKGQPQEQARTGSAGPAGQRRSQNAQSFSFSGQTPDIDASFLREFERMFGSGVHPNTQTARGTPFFSFSGMPDQGDTRKKSRPKQGGPLFTSTAVQELRFDDHETQIRKLSSRGPAVVLFYASGGKSCPNACHRIKKDFIDLAAARKTTLPVVAVQCLRRRGACAKYADHFPAVVFFGANARHDVLSRGVALSASILQQRVDKALSSTEVSAKIGDAHELASNHVKKQPDMCDGQFCLFLFEAGQARSMRAARQALVRAATMLKSEPVTVFFTSAEKHRAFAASFSSATPALRNKPTAPRAVLYRPKRGRFDVFEGDVQDSVALADFVSRAINRGTALPYSVQGTPENSF